jgi:hypothetical protein
MCRSLCLAILAMFTLPLNSALSADVQANDECDGPCLEYAGSFDLKAEGQHSSDNSISDSLAISPSSESNFNLKANDMFSVMANIVSESVIDTVPGKNQFFEGMGTYIDVLQAQVDLENFSIWGGKIHPAFGRAWDLTPGLHGTDLAEDYELVERVGAGTSVGFEVGGFAHILQASAFTVDRSILGESLFKNRGRTRLTDGGAGNTNGISSFAVALDGCMGAEVENCYDDGKFGYQLAARYQKGGDASDGNELGFVGGMNTSFAVDEETKLRLFGEAAWFRNFDGSADNAFVITGSGELETGAMTYSMAYTQERILVTGGADTSAHLLDVTAMYDLGDTVSLAGETWSIGAGYSYAKADGETFHSAGLKLSTEFATNFPFGN